MGLKKVLKSRPLTTSKAAPVRNGMVRLMLSNMYPAIVGATVRRPIRAELLTPMAVAISLGSTILVAKDCLIGIENINTTLNATIKTMAKGNDVDMANSTVRIAATKREATRVRISPNRFTTIGTKM